MGVRKGLASLASSGTQGLGSLNYGRKYSAYPSPLICVNNMFDKLQMYGVPIRYYNY